jgi:large subunit ribosomal protein L31
MKKEIHPKYNKNITVTCSCGNTFKTGSTLENISVEVCYACHPFYTGKEKIVDTMNLVKKFEDKKKAANASGKIVSKSEKQAARRQRRASKVVATSDKVTLKDMLKQMQ